MSLLGRALERKRSDPPPVWLMRQAGRYLPEYREARARAGSFWTMCMTPELAAAVTLQPIERFGLDAAIIFSDILVVPHALGQDVRFEEGTGPILGPLGNISGLMREKGFWAERLAPVYRALALVRAQLSADKALIGFAGAPWTLAAYMIEGQGSKDQSAVRLFAYRKPEEFSQLIAILVDAVSWHLTRQLESGADVVQLFDSWAGGLPQAAFENWVLKPAEKIVAGVRRKIPNAKIIGFPRQTSQSGLVRYMETGVDAIGIDTGTPLGWAAETLGRRIAIQGNLDPALLVAGGDAMDRAIDAILEATAETPFVFNLGHGVLPNTPPENVARLVARIRSHERRVR